MKIGIERRFNFTKDKYIIKEIIDDLNIVYTWVQEIGVCPYCNRKIEKKSLHIIHRIEILVNKISLRNKNYTKKDLLILGFTKDGRIMKLSNSYLKDIEKESKILKKIKEKK